MAGKVTYTPFISKSFPDSEAIKPIPISFSNLTPRGADPDREVIPIQYQPVTKEEPKKDEETPFTWAKLVLDSKPKGSHQFKTSDIQVGQMQDFLDILAKNNIFVRVTSGVRKGARTSNGNISNHDRGIALDITPIEGET